ncbi:MAG: UDP-glucuronate 4-epimerase [Planctomycetota bacterium]|jgi:UDP-glucuronate 4-epimerase
MKVVVTGGAGFIGSHLCERLLARGDVVWVLDNFNDFYDPEIKRDNVRSMQALAKRESRPQALRVIEGDIRDQQLVAKIFKEFQPDGIVHLAAMAGVRPSLEDPLLYEEVNVRGTLLLLEELRKRPEMRFVFASSSSVYGGNENVPFRETDDIPHPVSPYAATKRAGELLAYTYHHLYGVDTTCLRFFTVYGPRQRPEMAIHKFVRKTLAGEPLPFFGDGSTRRDYTYIDDIVDGVVRSLDRCKGYEIYNLGESATTSLDELVRAIGIACGKDPVLNRLPMQPGDVLVTYASVDKAREGLGYAPSTTVEQGLAQFMTWYHARAVTSAASKEASSG